jgi:hypothetical protein
MPGASSDVWEVMSTARTVRRFTDDPVDEPHSRDARRPRRGRRRRNEVTVKLDLLSVEVPLATTNLEAIFADPGGNWIELFGTL